MRVADLKKDELIYELSVRGVVTSPEQNVDELRSCLRSLLKIEKSGNTSIQTPEYGLKFEEEFTIVSDKLVELKDSLDKLPVGGSKTKFDRLQSRVVHLLHRIDRIPVDKIPPESLKSKSDLLVKILCTLDQLSKASKRSTDAAVLFSTNDGSSASSSSESGDEHNNSQSENILLSSTVRPSNLPLNLESLPGTSSHKSEAVHKWNLKFTGNPKEMSVHNFLERVTELRVARHVSEKEIFDSAIDLFAGKALNWFRANRTRFTNWKTLSELLVHYYEPPDYKSRLLREILDRTQDTSENIVDYLSCMQAMFRRYGCIPEDVQVDIICKNLSPFYAMQLPSVKTLQQLEDECMKLEIRKYRADNYAPPSKRHQSRLVEPDFAFLQTEVPTSITSPIEPTEFVAAAEVRQHTMPARQLTCWNCHKIGHINRQCPSPRTTHCFRCGSPGVTVKTCNSCSGTGNVNRENL